MARFEPHADFDFAAVDSPHSLALDDMTAIATRMCPGLNLTMDHAMVTMAWAATQGPSIPVLELAALWMGGCKKRDHVPIRAAVFIREFAPHARHAYELEVLSTYHRTSKQMICKLIRGLRAAMQLPVVGKPAAAGGSMPRATLGSSYEAPGPKESI